MKQLEKQISEKEETTSIPPTNLLTFNKTPLIKKSLKRLLALIFLIIVSLFTTVEIPSKAMSLITRNNENSFYILQVRNYSEERLIKEVEAYMKSIVPTGKLNATLLVQLCNKYQIDITLVIAQGIVESHLGTKGLAAQTNSVWNVGTYDNGKIHYTYSNPNESIEPYLKLLRERYLIRITAKGDTLQKEIKSLLADRGYVNYDGKRFASSPSYENSLRSWIIRVQLESKIKLYQDIKSLSDEDILAFFIRENAPQDSTLLANL